MRWTFNLLDPHISNVRLGRYVRRVRCSPQPTLRGLVA